MRVFLTLLIVICTILAILAGLAGLMLGLSFSAHFIKGDPDASFWHHLRLGLSWGAILAAAPAIAAVVLALIRRYLLRSRQ